tara:strand:- start:2244 stop:3188 length:945 start_codon:yes stop_codon:yes gene_type:complete
MDSMFDLVVGKTLAYKTKTGGGVIAGAHEIDLLSPGAIAIFAESGLMVETTTTAAALKDVKSFYIAAGRTNDVKVSQLIDRDSFHRFKGAYLASTLQVTTVTPLNLPTTYVAEEEAEVSIFLRDAGIEPAMLKERHSISVVASETNTTCVAKIVAKINADSKYVTALVTVAGTTFTLTAKSKNTTFDVGFNGPVIKDAIATVSTPAVFSKGQGADLVSLESQGQIYDGSTSPIWYSDKLFTQSKEIVTATNYIQYQLNWEQESRTLNSQNTAILGVTMLLPTGTAIVTSVDAILALLVSTVPSTGSGQAAFSTL